MPPPPPPSFSGGLIKVSFKVFLTKSFSPTTPKLIASHTFARARRTTTNNLMPQPLAKGNTAAQVRSRPFRQPRRVLFDWGNLITGGGLAFLVLRTRTRTHARTHTRTVASVGDSREWKTLEWTPASLRGLGGGSRFAGSHLSFSAATYPLHFSHWIILCACMFTLLNALLPCT